MWLASCNPPPRAEAGCTLARWSAGFSSSSASHSLPIMSQVVEREAIVGYWPRHGWKFLFGLVTIIGLFGIGDVLRGLDADPAIVAGITGLTPEEMRAESEAVARMADLQVRAGGLQLLVLGVLWGVIVVVPFRRHERWAWYTMWTFPGWALAVSVSYLFVDLQPGEPVPPPAISGWFFLALTSALLFVTRGGRVQPSEGHPS